MVVDVCFMETVVLICVFGDLVYCLWDLVFILLEKKDVFKISFLRVCKLVVCRLNMVCSECLFKNGIS